MLQTDRPAAHTRHEVQLPSPRVLIIDSLPFLHVESIANPFAKEFRESRALVAAQTLLLEGARFIAFKPQFPESLFAIRLRPARRTGTRPRMAGQGTALT